MTTDDRYEEQFNEAEEVHELSEEDSAALLKNVEAVLEFYDKNPQVTEIQVLCRNDITHEKNATDIKADPDREYIRSAVANALLYADDLKRVPFIFTLADNPKIMGVDATVDMRVPFELHYRKALGPDYYMDQTYKSKVEQLKKEGKL